MRNLAGADGFFSFVSFSFCYAHTWPGNAEARWAGRRALSRIQSRGISIYACHRCWLLPYLTFLKVRRGLSLLETFNANQRVCFLVVASEIAEVKGNKADKLDVEQSIVINVENISWSVVSSSANHVCREGKR